MASKRANRRVFLGLALMLLLGIQAVGQTGQAAESTIAIVGATLIDGNGGPAVPDAAIVVAGKRISAIGPRAKVAIPNGAKVVDGTGKFVTPGFIDTAIEGLVELGMTASGAIVAATKNGAIASKGLKDFGTLEAGKLADLVMLDADPLASISNIRKVNLVMKEGGIVEIGKLPESPVFTPQPSTDSSRLERPPA